MKIEFIKNNQALILLLLVCVVISGCQAPKKPIAQVDNTIRTPINDEFESEQIWRLAGYGEYDELVERQRQEEFALENAERDRLAENRPTDAEIYRLRQIRAKEQSLAVEKWERSKLPKVIVNYFARGSSTLSLSSAEDLNIEKLIERAQRVDIRGRTDGVGNDERNDRLALKRALSAKRYLLEKGVDEAKISLNYSAENNFVTDDKDDEQQRLNRRVEIEFTLEPVLASIQRKGSFNE